jgi:hypothetical protein
MFFFLPPPSSGYPQYTRAPRRQRAATRRHQGLSGHAAATRRQRGGNAAATRRQRGGNAAPHAGSPDIRRALRTSAPQLNLAVALGHKALTTTPMPLGYPSRRSNRIFHALSRTSRSTIYVRSGSKFAKNVTLPTPSMSSIQ